MLSSCRAWEPSLKPSVRVEDAHAASSKRVAFSRSNTYLASAGYQGKIKIWSVPELRPLLTFSEHRDTPLGITWLDDRIMVSGDVDGRMFRWDTTSGKILQHRTMPAGFTALVFLPVLNRIVSGHRDGVVRSYDADTLKSLDEYNAGAKILSVAAAHRQHLIAISCNNRRVILLDHHLETVRHFTPPPVNAAEIAFSPDDDQLAGGGWYKLFFWETSTGRIKVVKSDHWGIAFSIDYTPDGSYLATIGRMTDSEIYLVDPQTGDFRHHLKRHELCGAALRVSFDGNYLATGSDDASIRLYDLSLLPKPRK
jgi:WD40 repeat protein